MSGKEEDAELQTSRSLISDLGVDREKTCTNALPQAAHWSEYAVLTTGLRLILPESCKNSSKVYSRTDRRSTFDRLSVSGLIKVHPLTSTTQSDQERQKPSILYPWASHNVLARPVDPISPELRIRTKASRSHESFRRKVPYHYKMKFYFGPTSASLSNVNDIQFCFQTCLGYHRNCGKRTTDSGWWWSWINATKFRVVMNT